MLRGVPRTLGNVTSYWWHMQGRARQAPQPAGRHPRPRYRSHVPSLGNTNNISELRCGNLALSMQHKSRHELMYLTPSETPTKPIPGSGHCHLPSVRNLGTCARRYDGQGNLRSCRLPDEMHSTLIEQCLLCQGVVVPWTTKRPHIMQIVPTSPP